MNDLYNKLLKVKQQLNSASPSNILHNISIEFLFYIDNSDDSYLKDNARYIDKAIDKYNEDNIAHKDQLLVIFDKYYESFFYTILKSKLIVDHLPERSSPTPDFKVNLFNKIYYIEYKSLKISGGSYSYKCIDEEFQLKRKLAVPQKFAGGEITTIVQEVNPYNKRREFKGDYTVKRIVEELIDKISNNIKPDQFQLGSTVLAIDLTDQLTLFNTICNEIKNTYTCPDLNQNISGILYNVAAGKLDDEIISYAEFAGMEQPCEKLEKNGILRDYPFITAILFHITPFGKSSGFAAIYRQLGEREYDDTLVKMLNYICNPHCVLPMS